MYKQQHIDVIVLLVTLHVSPHQFITPYPTPYPLLEPPPAYPYRCPTSAASHQVHGPDGCSPYTAHIGHTRVDAAYDTPLKSILCC